VFEALHCRVLSSDDGGGGGAKRLDDSRVAARNAPLPIVLLGPSAEGFEVAARAAEP